MQRLCRYAFLHAHFSLCCITWAIFSLFFLSLLHNYRKTSLNPLLVRRRNATFWTKLREWPLLLLFRMHLQFVWVCILLKAMKLLRIMRFELIELMNARELNALSQHPVQVHMLVPWVSMWKHAGHIRLSCSGTHSPLPLSNIIHNPHAFAAASAPVQKLS